MLANAFANVSAPHPGSGSPSIPKVPADRLPFRWWRCIWDPTIAADHSKCEPFAKLKITVIEAAAIVFDGNEALDTLDPYVTLALNSEDEDRMYKTAWIGNCRAPKWNQYFEMDVHHPSSTLSVVMNDADYGGNQGGGTGAAGHLAEDLDLLGLSDDLVGWLDIQLCSMPFNTKVGGWFDIQHADNYSDSFQGRMKRTLAFSDERKVGQIHIEFELSVNHVYDEFFAWCLPSPDLGHGNMPLDLAKLYKDVVLFTERIDTIKERAIPIIDYAQRILVKPIAALVLAGEWLPQWHAYTLTFGVCMLTLSFVYLGPSKKLKDPKAIKDDSHETTMMALQSMIPAEGKVALRETASKVQDAVKIVDALEMYLSRPRRLTILIFFVIIGLGELFRVFGEEIRWIVLTAICVGLIVMNSSPLRLCNAFGHYQPYKRRGLRGGDISRLIASTCPKPLQHERKHEFKIATFSEATWCCDCSAFLMGFKDQGMKCASCGIALCHKCASTARPNCAGPSKAAPGPSNGAKGAQDSSVTAKKHWGALKASVKATATAAPQAEKQTQGSAPASPQSEKRTQESVPAPPQPEKRNVMRECGLECGPRPAQKRAQSPRGAQKD